MVKYWIFIIFLAFVIFYPVYESKNIKIVKYKQKKVVPTVIYKGKYFVYKDDLIKKGSFKKLLIFSKNKITAFDFFLDEIPQKQQIFASKAVYVSPLLKGYDILYFNNQYSLKTTKAIYNTKTSVLKGGKFMFYSADYRGYGKSFIVDRNKNIKAENIVYYLKVKQ